MLRPRVFIAMIASLVVVLLGALFQRFGPELSFGAPATTAAPSTAAEEGLPASDPDEAVPADTGETSTDPNE